MPYISNENVTVQPQNITAVFKDEFSTLNTTNNWDLSLASGDLAIIDGNSSGVSYLVISKDPLTAGTETTLTSKSTFLGPLEASTGLSMSQRIWGQELAIEFVSTDTPLTPIADIAISSISHSGSTLTVTTATPHGLASGSRITVYGVSDSRFNYPELVIASIINPTTFSATASAIGTISVYTLGPYTSQGFVRYRPPLGYAQDGFSMIFESTSINSASYYNRAGSGEAFMSGTFNGNHSIGCSTISSTALISAANTYAFIPQSEYRFILQQDKLHFYDVGVDSSALPSARIIRTTVVPSINKTYKMRYRATNDKSLSVPVGKIVSSTKTGSSTATIITDVPHGLNTLDSVIIYGNRDQTNFASLSTATLVASVINATTFTVAYGASTTATTYGGMVVRVQASQVLSSFTTAAVQTATVTATELTLIGHANWPWSIGDYVNLYGCRNNTNGGDMGIDGVYKVSNVFSTTLVLVPIGSTTLPAPFVATNCGGTVIRRTDTRIANARVHRYARERVEVLSKSDPASSISVVANGGSVAVSSSAILINQQVTDIASGVITINTTNPSLTPGAGALAHEINAIVTAASGTNPTMDLVVQESDDGGTNWYDVYHFPRITAVGQYRSPLIQFTGNRIRYIRTITGTSPSFTMSLNRLQSSTPVALQRQFFDRILDPNTLNSVTSSYFTEGCVDLNIFIDMGAVTTTAPTLVFEVSPDNTNWVQVGTDLVTAANINYLIQAQNVQARFSRLRVKTAGTGATLVYSMIKGVGR